MSVISFNQKSAERRPAKPKRVNRDQAMAIASGFIVRHLRDRCLAGLPSIVQWQSTRVWVAPILLTYPGKGIIGEVGMIAVDSKTGKVCGHTPKADLEAAALNLTRGRRNEIEAAFHRARKS